MQIPSGVQTQGVHSYCDGNGWLIADLAIVFPRYLKVFSQWVKKGRGQRDCFI